MVTWLIMAVVISRGDVIRKFFQHHLYVVLLWPGVNLLLAFFSEGSFSNRQISIALSMLIPWYFVIYSKKSVLAVISRITLGYLTLIALTTLIQYLSYPNIARDLAGLEMGILRASPLLGNFDTVYQAVPLIIVLTGVTISFWKDGRGWIWLGILVIQLAFVGFSRYRIAILTLMVFFVITTGISLFKKYHGQRFAGERFAGGSARSGPGVFADTDLPVRKKHGPAILSIIGLYSIPALLLLVFRDLVFRLIYLADLRLLKSSVSLLNRLRVYLKSVILFLDHPIRGISQRPDRADLELGYHSTYFDLLGEYGLTGFLFYMSIWIALLYCMKIQIPAESRWLYTVAVIAFLLLMFVNPVLDVSAVVLFLVILPGLFWPVHREEV